MSQAEGGPSDQAGAGTNGAPVAAYEPENIRSRFAGETHSYIVDHIRLADEKAAFFFGASAAVLYLLFLDMQKDLGAPLRAWNVRDAVGTVAMTVLGIACLTGIAVVTPRRSKRPTGLIYFKAIAQFASRDSYVNRIVSASDDDLISEKVGHCYELAKVCDRKFTVLAWELRLLFVGLIAAVSYLVFLAR